jgi:hypothetical protein
MRGRVEHKRHRPMAVGVFWGTGGFLLGAAFSVYLGAAELTTSGLPQPLESPASGCTSLALDRHSGSTREGPCPTPSLSDILTAFLGDPRLP